MDPNLTFLTQVIINIYRGDQERGMTVSIYMHLQNTVEALNWGCTSASGVGGLVKTHESNYDCSKAPSDFYWKVSEILTFRLEFVYFFYFYFTTYSIQNRIQPPRIIQKKGKGKIISNHIPRYIF